MNLYAYRLGSLQRVECVDSSIPLSTPGVFRPKSRELGGKRGTFGRCDNNLLLHGLLDNEGHKGKWPRGLQVQSSLDSPEEKIGK